LETSDYFELASGYAIFAVVLAFMSVAVSTVCAVAKGMGNWVPAALWLGVPAFALTVGVFGGGEDGMDALGFMSGASTSEAGYIAWGAWQEMTASVGVTRIGCGLALGFVAMTVAVGGAAGRYRVEQDGERHRQWAALRVLLGFSVLWGVWCVVTGLALLGSLMSETGSWDYGPALSGELPSMSMNPGIGGGIAIGLAALVVVGLAVPSWRELIRKRSMLGVALTVLLMAGWVGAESVVYVQRVRMVEAITALEAPSTDDAEPAPGEPGDPDGVPPGSPP